MTAVSVIVPTRNRRALLEATLSSVLSQQEVDLEVIVVDEASTDGTPAMLASLVDRRVHVIRNGSPRGVSSARNQGAAAASGEWVAFVDDDDLWAPTKLVRQLQAARAANRDWVYAGSVSITDRGGIIDGHPPLPPEHVVTALRRYNAIPGGGSNVIIRGTTLRRAGPFDTRLHNYCEDWELWIRLAQIGPPAWVCSPLIAYRVHDSNASLDTAGIERGAQLIEQLHATRVDWGRLHRFLADSCLRTGQRRAAVSRLAKAAVRGQLRGVLSDVGAAARRRVWRSAQPRISERARAEKDWTAQAAAWLVAFEPCASRQRPHEHTRAECRS